MDGESLWGMVMWQLVNMCWIRKTFEFNNIFALCLYYIPTAELYWVEWQILMEPIILRALKQENNMYLMILLQLVLFQK